MSYISLCKKALLMFALAFSISSAICDAALAVIKSEAKLIVPHIESGLAEVPLLFDYNNKRINIDAKAECLIGYDTDSIVFNFTIPIKSQYQPNGLNERDGVIWNDDRIEIFLQPYGTDSVYQFIVNSVGALYDSKDQNKFWNSDIKYSCRINKDNWTVSVTIPFAQIGFDPAKGDTFKCNVAVASNEPGNSFCLTWNQMPIDFLDKSQFGTLKLSPALPFIKKLRVSKSKYDGSEEYLSLKYDLKNPSPVAYELTGVDGTTAIPASAEKSVERKIRLEQKRLAAIDLGLGDLFAYKADIENITVPNIELIANTVNDFTIKLHNEDVLREYVKSVALNVDGKTVVNCPLSALKKKNISTKNWKPGYHKFDYLFYGNDKKVFARVSQKIYTFIPPKVKYKLSELDASRYYPKVTYKKNILQAARSVFNLSTGILPSQIKVENRPLLDKPIRMVFNGNTLKLNGNVKKVSANKNQICLMSVTKTDGKTVTVKADHQYDGFTWYDVKIQSDKPLEYGPLDVVIPLKLDSDVIMGHDMLYFDDLFGKEKITNIGAPTDLRPIEYNNKYIPQGRMLKSGESVNLPLTSWMSLCTDTDEQYRGLGISCEGPAGWNIENYDNIYRVVRKEDGKVDLTLHISDGKTRWKTREIRFSFGIEPFPVRKYNNTFHSDFRFDCTFWPQAHECIDKTVDGESMLFFDRLIKEGVTIELCHERWTEFENYWKAGCNEEDIKKTVVAAKKSGLDLYFYFGFLISNMIPEFPLYHDLAFVKPTSYPEGGFRPYPYYQQGDPDQAAFGVCYNSFWGDCYAQGIIDHVKRFNTRGVYYDGGPVPQACANLKHGCGVIDLYKRLIVSFPVRSYRRMAEKVYNAGLKVRRDFATDIGLNYPNIPAMGLTESYWTGEAAILFDPAGNIGPQYLRGMLNGKLYGIPCDLIKRPEASIDSSWAQSLILDTYPRLAVGGGREWVLKAKSIWGIYDKYKLTSDTFTPYFAGSNKVIKDNPNVYISYYNSKQALVLVLSNCWNANEQRVDLDLSKFGSLGSNARDVWMGEDLKLTDSRLSVPVLPGNMRVIVIER